MPKLIYLLGCGGHARSVADVLQNNDPEVELIFIDQNARDNEIIMGYKVLKNLPVDAHNLHVASGDSKIRERDFSNRCITIISKDAYVSNTATILDGVFIGHFAYIGPEAKIGDGCILNTRSIIEHEVHVGSFCHISVNSTLCGRVVIGSHVFVGANTVIKDKICICDDVIIGAGSTVVADIVHPGVYVGNPARFLRKY